MTSTGAVIPTSLQPAIDEFRADPSHARWNTAEDVGGCWDTARAFARILHRCGIEYVFRRYRNLPHSRTDHQHVIEVGGLIVDWDRAAVPDWV